MKTWVRLAEMIQFLTFSVSIVSTRSPLGNLVEQDKTLLLQTNTKTRVQSVALHSLPVQCLVYQLSLKPLERQKVDYENTNMMCEWHLGRQGILPCAWFQV